MIVQDSEYVLGARDITIGEIDATLEGIGRVLGSDAVGMKNPSSADLASFFFHQNVMYPPRTFMYPDGHTVTASPWILHLEFCENGADWFGRFNRFVRANGQRSGTA